MAEASVEWDDTSQLVVQSLKALYMECLRPIEIDSHFSHFHGSALTASEIEARPQVLLVGQYSTGKTSFIKWVTGIDSTFFDIRPQPSTDKFIAVVHGDEEKVINGDAATCLPELPYGGLSKYGSGFLSKFQVLVEPADILRRISFLDTPGVLSGDKQRVSRGYDFQQVTSWLASRCDLILLLFDAHKLDISDEFKEVIEAMRSHGDKCRCVLNKADEIDGENLVKVYGALMWNLGKILMTPEVARMYIGSFWDQEYKCKDLTRLLDQDRKDLMRELRDLPRNVCVRRVNEVVARARMVKVHLALGDALRSRLPFFGSCGRRRRHERWLCDHLPEVFLQVTKEHQLAQGDLPNLESFRERLLAFKDFSHFPLRDDRQRADLDRLIQKDIPKLMTMVGGVSASGLRERSHSSARENTWTEPPKRRSGGACGWLCCMVLLVVCLMAATAAAALAAVGALPPLPQLRVSGSSLGGISFTAVESAPPAPQRQVPPPQPAAAEVQLGGGPASKAPVAEDPHSASPGADEL